MNRTGNLNSLTRHTTRKGLRCTCRCRLQATLNHTSSKQYPFASRLNANLHEALCVYATSDHIEAQTSLRYTYALTLLRWKIQASIYLCSQAGTWSVQPSLICQRIVTRDSPAFKFIGLYLNSLRNSQNDDHTSDTSVLFKMFENRECSPHDRLPDGTTLLHVGKHLAVILQHLTKPDSTYADIW